jgi:predicted lipoprotein
VLVNQLAMTIEAVAEQRLKFITLLPEPLTHQLDRIEGSRSGTSLQSVLAILKGAEKMYRGGEGLGLDDYLAHLCLPAETRLRDQFQAANKASEKIGAPLEEATTKDKTLLPAAYESTRTLEVLCKTDLASGLGVTLTFSSTDND